MSQLLDALQKYEALQATRQAEEAELNSLVAAQSVVKAKFNDGATLTVGPTFLPKPVNDLLQQMTADLNTAAANVAAQVTVVQAAYKAEQDQNNVVRNLLQGSLNVGAGSIA